MGFPYADYYIIEDHIQEYVTMENCSGHFQFVVWQIITQITSGRDYLRVLACVFVT